jgi:restriction endonuclease Mrr
MLFPINTVLKSLWPLWVLIGAVLLFRLLEEIWPDLFDLWKAKRKFKAGKKWRSDRELLYYLRGLTPSGFEDYIAELFSKMGFKTQSVGGAYDGGVDVIAEKDGVKHYIQCKKFFKSREVGVGEVRDFYGAIADHLAEGKGYFITTNKFTLEAERFAEDKPIELIDSFKLLKYIRSVEK